MSLEKLMTRRSYQHHSALRLSLALATISFCAAMLSTNGIASQTQPTAAGAKSPQSAKPAAPHTLSEIDLAGYNKLLADHKGKPLLVTFWATWCEPCRDEFPIINQIARDYASKGLVVLGVDMDDDAAVTLIQHFLDRNKPIFPSVRKKMGHEDAFIRGVNPQWHDEMPANFFYAADGRLLGFMIGGHTREDFDKIITTILSAGASTSHP
jgi:cytochrome c biogenesis protein CcmG, thiol:disulfide interchange protein DsbE